jgi:hypothetical protein
MWRFAISVQWSLDMSFCFFAGTGAVLGVAALAGSGWILAAGILFLAMAV